MIEQHLSGPKTGRHTTVIRAGEKVARKILTFPEVTKISFGYIRQARGAFSIKFFDAQGGLQLRICGSKAIQDIFIYTKDREATRKKIEELYPNAILR